MERRFILALMSTLIAAVCVPGGARVESAGASREEKAAAVPPSGEGEVALDLVVRDKHGHLIRDLRPEEIKLTDGGAPASIRSVRLAGTSPQGAGRENRPPHAIVLMFDSLGADAARLAREGALELVRDSAEADAVVAVLFIGSRVGVLQPFTSDRDALKKSVEMATSSGSRRSETVTSVEDGLRRLPPETGAAGQAPPARLLLEAVAASERAARDQRARPAMASLIGLARTLAKLPGRKVIVYFSEGMRLSTSESTLFQGLISESNTGRVSVYAVDASETTVQASAQAMLAVASVATNQRPSNPGIYQPPSQAPMAGGVQPYPYPAGRQYGSISDGMPTGAQEALRELSVSTGGLLVPADADVKKQMRRILEDESNYYEIVYSPHEEPQQGQFRKIGIEMNRPDLRVQGPSGYIALPSSTGQFAVFEAPLAKAIRDQSGEQDPGIRVRAFELRPGAGMVTGEVVAEIPLSRLHVQEIAAEKVARLHFSVLALILDESGREIARCSEDVPWRVALETKDRALAEVYTFVRPFTAPPGKYRVEVALHDRLADKIALAHATFESRAANVPAMSEAILARMLEEAPPASDLDDPMLFGAKRVVPDLRPVVTSTHDEALPLFLILYPDLAVHAEPTLAVQVLGSGVTAKATPLALGQTAGRRSIPYVVDIPVKKLPAGNYTVKATFTQGAARIEREASFVVAGELRPAAPPETAAAAPPPDFPESISLPKPRVEAGEKLGEKEQATILAGGRERALAYSNSLPNISCIETTRRFALKSGANEWKPQDTLSELVRYMDGMEDRRLIEVNGAPLAGDRSSLSGTFSSGEFGHLLKVVFGDKAHATFTWKETAFLDGVRCQVFTCKVDRAHSGYRLATKGGQQGINVAYIGTVYITASTFNIRRVSLEAIEIPSDFPVRASSVTVDYAHVRVGDSDYLLPVSGAVELQQGRKSRVRNEVRFRDYHRLGSQTTIRYSVN